MRELISLGRRCDTAFQARMHSGVNVAHFFDWLVTPSSALVKVFEEDFDVFRPEHFELKCAGTHRYVYDRYTQISFHHQFPAVGPDVTPDFLLFYPAFIRKFRYLAERFRTYARERPVTFIRRDVERGDAELIESAFFSAFPEADAEFLYVIHTPEMFTTAHGRSLSADPPKTGLGDLQSWARLLVDNGLVVKPYRLSSEQVLGSHDDHGLVGAERASEAALEEATAMNPDNIHLRLELSRVYQQKSDWTLAEAVLPPAELCGSTPEIDVERAFIRWRAGKISADVAVDGLPNAVDIIDDSQLSPQIQQNFLDMLVAKGDFSLAVKLCDTLLERNPQRHGLYYLKAVALSKLRIWLRGRWAIDSAIRLAPRRPAYHRLRTTILTGLNLLEEAIQSQDQLLRLAGSSGAYHTYASLLLRAGRTRDAVEAFEEAIRLNPANSVALQAKIAGALATLDRETQAG